MSLDQKLGLTDESLHEGIRYALMTLVEQQRGGSLMINPSAAMRGKTLTVTPQGDGWVLYQVREESAYRDAREILEQQYGTSRETLLNVIERDPTARALHEAAVQAIARQLDKRS